MRRRPTSLFVVSSLILLGISTSAAAAEPVVFERVSMTDVRFAAGQDLTAAMRSGPVVAELPFTFYWRGRAYGAMEVGPGWARLVGAGEGRAGDHGVIAGRGGEATPRPGPTFEALAGAVSLGPAGRVQLVEESLRFAVRFWDLQVEGGSSGLAAELIFDRVAGVRIQYLQVQALAGELPSSVRAGISQPGFGRADLLEDGVFLQNGLSLRVEDPLPRIQASPDGPPPAGCSAPTESWCDTADGPGANAVIRLDSRFDETPLAWTLAGEWRQNPFATCAPGAFDATPTGMGAYVGNPTTCTVADSVPDSTMMTTVPVTGINATSRLIFSFRAQYGPFPQVRAELLCGTDRVVILDPATLPNPDPTLWWTYNPIDISACAADSTFTFRFVHPNAPSAALGYMVDEFIIYDETPADIDCSVNGHYADANPSSPNSACSDTVATSWVFDENRFCADCPHTFYILVECGTEMHLPLTDMEAIGLTISEVVTSTSPTLTCENPAFRDPMMAPVVLEADCCPAFAPDGIDEVWFGPAFSMTDPSGSIEWGFNPTCGDLGTRYDLDMNGLTCADLDPPCGGVLDRLTPGESTVMDCFIEGDPGLCGIYRVDVRSGGNVWNLFANCVGDQTETFNIYRNCEDAWAAFNPLPEIAISDATEVGNCPDTDVQFTLSNIGCSDLTDPITVRATSSCVPADVTNWTIAGGIPANASVIRNERMTVSCTNASLTLDLDPMDVLAECSESGSAAACAVIAGSDSTNVAVCGGCAPPAYNFDITSLRMTKDDPSGTHNSCTPGQLHGSWLPLTTPNPEMFNVHELIGQTALVADRTTNATPPAFREPYPTPSLVTGVPGSAAPNTCMDPSLSGAVGVGYYTVWQNDCGASVADQP